jgi:Holliday junction resolvasome RuvABC endonuclease subunit
MNGARLYALVLAVYPNTLGFAFVLFEGHLSPVDWGVKDMRGRRQHSRYVARITAILDRHQPDILVLQDTSPTGTRRSRRVTNLNTAVAKLASARAIPVYAYSREEVRSAFAEFGLPNKHSMAELIAKHIPVLANYLPRPRKLWMSEDARMGIFDAAALALVFFQKAGGSEGPVG